MHTGSWHARAHLVLIADTGPQANMPAVGLSSKCCMLILLYPPLIRYLVKCWLQFVTYSLHALPPPPDEGSWLFEA
jgi:hypothetical protein